MPTYQELLEKSGIQIIGIVKSVNEFTSQKNGKVYFSVDVEAKGTKMPINIKLPENFNRAALQCYELTKLMVRIMPGFDRKGIELHAIA